MTRKEESQTRLNAVPREGLSSEGLIDLIAARLPESVQADYYRVLRYCRSLPEDDEMLRILNAMQFLTLLMVQVPDRVVVERERLEQLFEPTLKTLHAALESSEAYQRSLDKRIAQLPETIAQEVRPEVIAAKITEGLRQQFSQSTIPETAKMLAASADAMKAAAVEFRNTATKVGNAYHGVAEEARRAVAALASTSSSAIASNRREAEELSAIFRGAYRRLLWILCAAALVLGFVFGNLFQLWIHPPTQPVVPPVAAPEAPARTSTSRPKGRG